MKGSQNGLSLSPRWTVYVTRPFNLYKEGQGSPKRDKQETILELDTTRGEPVYGDSLVMIMRSSLKQHVGLLPDDVSWGPKLSKSLSCVTSFDSAQPLSSYYIDALASRLSPHTKDICRDNSTTHLATNYGPVGLK